MKIVRGAARVEAEEDFAPEEAAVKERDPEELGAAPPEGVILAEEPETEAEEEEDEQEDEDQNKGTRGDAS